MHGQILAYYKLARINTCAMKSKTILILQQNIKTQLKARNKSIEELTKEMKVNRNYISQLREGTPLNKLINISQSIGCSITDLLHGI